MKHSGIICNKCKYIIYSRAHYDFRKCKCGSCYVDGGFGYTRIGGLDTTSVSLEIEKSRRELYDDWSTKKDKFGLHSSVRPPKWIKFQIVAKVIEETSIIEDTKEQTINHKKEITCEKTLTPKQCAEQFRMYAQSHPSKDSKHSLNFCADFLDNYCKE